MNVIFTDFDGVINTLNGTLRPREKETAKEERIKILGDICKKYNCKVVIISGHKDRINEETLETDLDWIQEYFKLFKKYGVEVIGRTPCMKTEIEPGIFVDIWKETEIKAYLEKHPEIEHFCILDDDDRVTFSDLEKGNFKNSDLNMFREYLISPLAYSDTDPTIVGLQESHIEEVGKILQKKRIY